jgi:hypothetical protein
MGSFGRRLGRVERQLGGQQSGQGGGRPGVDEAGEQFAAAYLDGAPPPAWLTVAEWQRLAGHMQRCLRLYDEVAANAARFDGQRFLEPHDDESNPPDEGEHTDEDF